MTGISISIKAGATANTSTVQASGSVIHIITAKERTTFGIDDAALKNAVKTNFGQAPDDAYLCEPTPWDGLYNTYHWPQVQTSLQVQKAEILSITSEPAIIATKDFVNNSQHTANFNCGITDDVSNTTETSWSETNTIDVNQTISYDVSFLGTGGGGSTSFDYSYSWGQSGSESKTVTVGSSEGVSVDLKPGEKVQAKLTASRGVMKVQVTYLASVAGTVAINYGDKFKDHHFWGLDLDTVMQSANLPTTHVISETIEVGYYSNATIELVDPAGAVRMMAVARPAVAGAESPTLAGLAIQAKRQTVDDLKAFEAGKRQASAALTSKMADFRSSLNDNEMLELGALLGTGDAAGRQDGMTTQSAFLKPMQTAGGTTSEEAAFLKPMQRSGELGADEAAFLKPMQRSGEVGAEEAAFLKPMQRSGEVGAEEAAFLKPMQRSGEVGAEEAAFLKPMQRSGPTT